MASSSPEGQCEVCGSEASQRCGRCHVTAYCCRDHQKQHWREHKQLCRPYVVEMHPVMGRHLRASRDLLAGEVIMKDVPLVLGPRQITMPVCVGCSSSVDGTISCTDCGWPLCGTECQQVSLHQPECQASRARGAKVVITKYLQLNEMYECITPLRCLSLKKNQKKWETLMSMESHLEERQRARNTELDKSNVIDFIRGYLKYQNFVDEDIYKICGILEVNGFEIPAPNFVGLYGQACLLEHSCVPNSSRTFDTQMNVIIRATVNIKKGEHITTIYTDPMWGTSNRQMHLCTTKYFTCRCHRCLDPTELGTHFSSIKCQTCSGLIIPPHKPNQDWECPSCRTAISVDAVQKLLKIWGEKLADLRGNLVHSEEFLKTSASDLSEDHHYRIDVKLALAQLIGKHNDKQLSGLSNAQLKRKIEFCEEVLKLVDKFSPGQTRLRGLLLFELAMSRYDQHMRLDRPARIAKKQAAFLKVVQQQLEEAHTVLSRESPLQEDHPLAVQAGTVAGQVGRAIRKCKGGNK